MKNILKNIEEKMTLLQQEIHHLSDEVYNQQKEILELKLQIKKLKIESHNTEQNDGYIFTEEDNIPPHY